VRHWIAVAAGIAALSCGTAASRPSALVYDPFEARSQLRSYRAVSTTFTISLVEFQKLAEAAKKKFGEDVRTVLHGDTGKAETILSGKVVETSMLKARVGDLFTVRGRASRSRST
jgi:hypothetical protein